MGGKDFGVLYLIVLRYLQHCSINPATRRGAGLSPTMGFIILFVAVLKANCCSSKSFARNHLCCFFAKRLVCLGNLFRFWTTTILELPNRSIWGSAKQLFAKLICLGLSVKRCKYFCRINNPNPKGYAPEGRNLLDL